MFIPEKNMVVAVTSNDGDFATGRSSRVGNREGQSRSSSTSKAMPSGEADADAENPCRAKFSPRNPPFAAVLAGVPTGSQVGDEWFTLVSLDGIAAEDIVAFSRETFEDQWQKRFEEDLVELLTRMGHPPGDTVTLVVQSLGSLKTRTLENVPMTEANRRAIHEAARARE